MIHQLPGGSPDGVLQPAPALSVTPAEFGAAAGDVVGVGLPGGRVRERRVLRVVPTRSNDAAAGRAA